MCLLVIYNPVCGDGTAQLFVEKEVLPLLDRYGKRVQKLVATEHAGHAGTILGDFLDSVEGDDANGEVNVILASGDGTMHEMINGLPSEYSAESVRAPAPDLPLQRLHIIIVPCGTANALYSSLFPPTGHETGSAYRLQSVLSFVNGSQTIPLSLAITTVSAPLAEQKHPKVIVSSVVVSTALHASILYDSESLRQEMPGIERFKVAAQRNSAKWYSSSVKLLPSPSASVVQIYDSTVQAFVAHPESEKNNPVVELAGPFAYFLSTVNIDRLEPAFRITPLVAKIPSQGPVFDIVIVRPLRDPSISLDSLEARVAFVRKEWTVLSSAYEDGSHVNLRYTMDGEIVPVDGGPSVVEYIRCGGWEWIPNDNDEDAHLLCTDGTLSHIEKGGRAVSIVTTANARFRVHV